MTLRICWLALATIIASLPVSAQEIWYSPSDHLPRLQGRVYGPDFMQLFAPAAPWAETQRHIQIFVLNPRFPLAASDQDLRTVFDFLNQHKIALAVAMNMVGAPQNLPPEQGGCGYNTEGITKAGLPKALAERVKRLGGRIHYIAMDEPFWFGHEWNRLNACRYSIDEVATRVADSMRGVRESFPDVRVADAEPATLMQGTDWLQRLEAWFDAYAKATGRPLDSYQEDIWWAGPWRERVPMIHAALQRRGIKLGMMYNGSGSGKSDEAWVLKAQHNVTEFEEFFRGHPDQVAFGSSLLYPSHVLPEVTPTTVAYVIRWYVARRH